MKKKFLILVLLLLCTGCNDIKYKVTFGDEITETIEVFDKNYVHENLNREEGYMDDISAFEYFFQTLPYSALGDREGNYTAVKEHKSLSNYLNDSFVFDKYYSKDDIKVSGSKVKINLSINDNVRNYISDMDSFQVSLYIPYYVSKHNADNVSNNTYTWNFDDLEKANLKINFDMSKSYKYKSFLSSILVIGILSVIIVAIIIYFVIKNKDVNKI